MSTLGAISSEVRNGISIKPSEAAGQPILRISAVRPMKLDTSDVRYLPCTVPDVDTYVLAEGDLLFTRYNGNRDLVAACARVGNLDRRLVYPDKLIRVRVRAELASSSYIEKAANCHQARAFIDAQLKTSAGQVGISGADLKRLPVALAPLREQARIADKLNTVLNRVDAVNTRLARVAPILKRFRQSVLAAATSGRLSDDIEPDADWCYEPLSNLGSVSGGLTKNAKRGNLPFKRPYLRVANVQANELRLDEILEIGLTDAEFSKTKLTSGDLLIVEGNGSIEQIGRVAIWSGEIADCTHQNHLIRWRAGNRLLPKFALYFLLSPEGRQRIEAVASSTTGLHTLSVSKVGDLRIPVPALEEQTEIVRRVETRRPQIWRPQI